MKQPQISLAGKVFLPTITVISLILMFSGCEGNAEKVEPGIQSTIDQIVESYIDKNQDPGLSMLVYYEGNTVFRKAYGMADVQTGSRYQPGMSCYTGSLAKQFTAMAIMILVERKLINLQKSITDYFPEYPDLWKDVTIHHLLTHQSGISDYLNDHGYAMDGMTNEDAIDYILVNGHMNFDPGEMFRYSNTGYVILAELVEKISGKPFYLFCEEEIFSPVGMEHTFFVNDNHQIPENRAIGHNLDGIENDYTLRTNGDGGLISTVDDMLLWDKSLDTGLPVSSETIITMMSPYADMKNGAYYGYGWYVDNFNGRELISHDGGIAGLFAYAGRIKEKNFYICLFGNSPNYPLFMEVIESTLEFYFPDNG
jgi:CubicO group peptidase (beta-lactamase class C family)